jgi:Putative porin
MVRKPGPLGIGALVCALSLMSPYARAEEAVEGGRTESSATAAKNSEIEQLKAMLLDQQRQINELRQELSRQRKDSDGPALATNSKAPLGEVASTTPIVPVGTTATLPAALASFVAPAPDPQGPTTAPDAVQKAIDAINGNLRGFRISGDFRFRNDLLVRSANTSLPPADNRAVPQQRDRERYRFRLNIDKDLFYSDKSDRALVHGHVQLATDPFNNPNTMDTDFTAFTTRAPISIAEAYIDFMPTKSLTFRIGRMPELYADNRQFVYDDDIRLNGFQETYRWNGKQNGFFVQFGAAQYILTDPNIQIVPAGSPFIAAGYPQGSRVPSSDLFDQGITIGSNINKKWSHNETLNYFTVRSPNQIALAQTANGAALFANNPAVGAVLIGNLSETGNATTTSGGPAFFASAFNVIRGGVNLNYSGSTWNGHNFPAQLFAQFTHNTGASIQNNGYMVGAALGQTAKLGDFQFQYQYFYKPANGFVSSFTDDDVGTGAGVNVKTHEIRINLGLTRFLAWENRFYIQNGITTNNPGINFFVPLQQGYNTQLRIHSQIVFTF